MTQEQGGDVVGGTLAPVNSGGRWYAGVFLLALAGTCLLLGFFLTESYEQGVQKARADGSNLSWVLERQLNTSLRRLDADLQSLQRYVKPAQLVAKDVPVYRSEVTQHLDQLKINFEEVIDYYVVSKEGDVLYSSGQFKAFNVAERTHFKTLSTDASAGLVYTDVVISKGNGRPTIVFARAFRSPAGEFLGLVSALVNLDYLQQNVASVNIGSGGLIAIRELGANKLILREPPIPAELNKSTQSPNYGRLLKGEVLGHEVFASPLDGLTRYVTFRAVSGYPFYIIVGLDRRDLMQGWQQQALVAACIVSVLLSIIALVLWRLWQAELARERGLADLLLARDAAEESSRSKGQFLANMSHEIRTPMNAILGMIQLLQGTDLNVRQSDYANKAHGAARSLLGLLNDILDFSKVEAGKMELEHEPFRLDRMLRDLAVVLSSNAGSKDIELLYDIDPGLPEVVQGDPLRLHQVLVNLGGNAVKFTQQGQVVLKLRMAGQTDHAVSIEFQVQDTGIGVAPEHQKRIFEGFSQAEASTTRKFGGTGLGLSICRRLVGLMGGELQLASVLGQGSTFQFTLEFPLVRDVPQALQMPPRHRIAPRRTLVIDDNPVASRIVQAIVQSWGWPVDAAFDGRHAIDNVRAALREHAGDFPYDVIFVDWHMPGPDGWETTRQLRQLSKECGGAGPCIIMVTAQGRDALAQRTPDEQSMLNGFLNKPTTASMLLDAVMDSDNGAAALRQAARSMTGGRELAGMRILVVEDNLINQQVADELLSAQGALVSLAANGQLGVEAVVAAAPPFDVVLMDIQMPVLDGYGATRAIRERAGFKDLPIIAMTANAMAGDRDACLNAGMSEHIGKPFDVRQLVSLLIRLTGFSAKDDPQDRTLAPVEPLPMIPGLDLAAALARMSGMRSLYVRTARDFANTLTTAGSELRLLLQAKDSDQAARLLHTLKGNSATLGAMLLSDEAARFEAQCQVQGGTEQCLQMLPTLEPLMASTRASMLQVVDLLSSPSSLAATPVAQGGLNAVAATEALQELRDLARAGDLSALQRFAELQNALDGLPDEAMQALEAALQALELEAAAEACDAQLAALANPRQG